MTKDNIMNRKTVITTVAAGLLIAGLPPAVAAAAPDAAPCAQWEFNGLATPATDSGNLIEFSANGPSLGGSANPLSPSLQPPTEAVDVAVGGQVGFDFRGEITGGITGDQISMTFVAPPYQQQAGIVVQMAGQVGPDGSAHGTAGDGSNWHMGPQLKCMSNGT